MYSFVQQAQGVALSSGTTVASSSLTVTAGNLLIVVVFASSTGTISIPTDSRGNTFTQGGDSPGIGDPYVRYAWFYCLNANGGAGEISASTTTTAPVRAIYVAEFSGLDQFIDDNFGYQATPTTGADAVSSGNANVTAQPALLFGLSFNGEAVSAPTAGSGFTSLTGVWDAGGGVTTRPQHRRVTATGNAAATFTATSNTSHYTVAIAFRETVAASATLSGATPSGTIASASVARLGATTDQSSGTLYAVIDSAANLSGITASQVKAGQRNNGSAALSSGNVTVSGASPWLVLTGLQPNTSYSYALVQNNANGDSNIVTGTFTTHATGADGLWPTAVSLSGRWIEDQNGDPWAALGDANVVLHHLGDADLADYLDGLVAHGITSVWWKLAMQKLESILAGMSLDKDGNSPFTGAWFQSTPTPGYWDNMERVVQQCAARGITCWLYPSWAGWTDDDGDRVIMEAATGGQMEDYGEYVGARFKDYPNIVWMNGGDRPSPGATLVARWGSIATGMLSQSVPQLWGLQGSRTVTKNDYITAASMGAQPFDLCTMYGDGLDPQTQAIAEYSDNIGPLVSYEMTYENEKMDSGTGSVITLDRLRYQYWGAFCAGGVGHIFGNLPRYAMDLVEAYQVSGMTWESTLNDPSGDDDRGTLDFAKHCAFMASLPPSWVDMLPDTTGTFLTSGEGTGATRAAARFNGSGTTGLLAVAYRPHGGSATLTFDLTEFAPTAVKISKLDPVSGSYTEIGTYPTSGSQNVGSLGNNTAGDSDWVLVFEATSTIESKVMSSALSLGDETVSRRQLNRTHSDAVSISDELSRFYRLIRSHADAIGVLDGSMKSIFAVRELIDGLQTSDGSIAYLHRNRTLTESIGVSDGALLSMLRRRLLGDDVGVSDELLAQTTGVIIYQRILDSLTTITDESMAFAHLRRLAGSNISVGDRIDQYTILHRMDGSEISVSDQIGRYALVTRALLDALSLDDDFDASLVLDQIIARILTSDIGLFDEPMSAMQRFILLSEMLSVQDDMTAAHIPHVGGLFVPRIMIGFDQPKIELGGYRV